MSTQEDENNIDLSYQDMRLIMKWLMHGYRSYGDHEALKVHGKIDLGMKLAEQTAAKVQAAKEGK